MCKRLLLAQRHSRPWGALAALLLAGSAARAQQFVDTGAALPPSEHSAADWGDYDRDGDLDLLIAGFGSSGEFTKLFRNDAGLFVDSGRLFVPTSGGAVRWADYDRDGDLDFFVAGTFDPGAFSRIYRNDGPAGFADIGGGLLPAMQADAAWADMDNDGDLDLMLGGSNLSGDFSALYRNDGSDTFVRVPTAVHGFRRGSLDWGDYDLDGDPDLLVTGLNADQFVPRSELYRNDGNAAFTIVPAGLVDAYDGAARWADFDADGDLDILLTGTIDVFSQIVTHLYRNDGGVFTELGQDLEGAGEGSSVAWADTDGDGDLDFVATAVFFGGTAHFRNDAGAFVEGGSELRDMCCGAVAWGDMDGDTDLDLVLSGIPRATKLYRNVMSAANAPPTPPGSLVAEAAGTSATLSWGAGGDAETPSSGLTYNVRVGRTPGGGSVVAPMAEPSGRRLLAAFGNTGPTRQRVLHDLEPGAYFWSVQAIDNGFSGSAFATEGSFTIEGTVSTPGTASGPGALRLAAVRPNPAGPSATFEVAGPLGAAGELRIYDTSGRLVRTLGRAGGAAAVWDGLTDGGAAAPPGAYVVELRAGTHREVRKFLFVR